MRVLVIIPAYNEEKSIALVIADIRKHVPTVDILVVNDGSTDKTEHAARQAQAEVLTLPFNVGIGGGMQTGYLYAKQNNYDVAVQMDADGQHPAEELPKLLEAIQDADLVIGSRYVEPSAYRSSKMRRVGMIFFSKLVSAITRERYTDTTSGFRAANRKVIDLYAQYYPMDYPEVESIVYLKRKGCRISEVSTEMRERQSGKSSITPVRSAYYMVKVTLAVMMCALRFREVKSTA